MTMSKRGEKWSEEKRSRQSARWTPEMREAARKRGVERYRARGAREACLGFWTPERRRALSSQGVEFWTPEMREAYRREGVLTA